MSIILSNRPVSNEENTDSMVGEIDWYADRKVDLGSIPPTYDRSYAEILKSELAALRDSLARERASRVELLTYEAERHAARIREIRDHHAEELRRVYKALAEALDQCKLNRERATRLQQEVLDLVGRLV